VTGHATDTHGGGPSGTRRRSGKDEPIALAGGGRGAKRLSHIAAPKGWGTETGVRTRVSKPQRTPLVND
jgi:hypothetical protein